MPETPKHRPGGLPRWLPFTPPFIVLVLTLIIYEHYSTNPAMMIMGVHVLILGAAAAFAMGIAFIASRERPRAEVWLEARAFHVTVALAALYCLAFSAMGIMQYNSLHVSFTDTADWEQMLHNTMHGRFLETTAFPHMFFGEHVQFVHLFLLPIYALFPSLKTLMILKSAALASGALPVYLLTRTRLKSGAVGVAFAAAYLLYPAMQYVDIEVANVYNTFRPVAFAIPAFLWTVYFLDRDKMYGFAVAAFLALASKEEMALPLAMMGLLLLVRRRWIWGAAVFIVSSAWFFASVLWIIPHFREGSTHMTNYYLDFGSHEGFAGLLWAILSDPLHTIKVAFSLPKISYLLLLLVPLGFSPLFSWRMLLVMLPSFATTLLASRAPSFTILFHYQAALVPFLVAGAVYGCENLAALAQRFRGRLFGTIPEDRFRRAVVGGLAALVVGSSLFGNIFFAQSPLSLRTYSPAMKTHWKERFVPSARTRLFFAEVAPLVPPEAPVSATEFLATYFARRKDDYRFPEGISVADYVVIDTRDPWLENRLKEKETTLQATLSDPAFTIIYQKEGFLVLRRIASVGDPEET